MSKSIFASKTLWFNVAAVALTMIAAKTGTQVDPTMQAALLAGGNALLRLVTNQPVSIGEN